MDDINNDIGRNPITPNCSLSIQQFHNNNSEIPNSTILSSTSSPIDSIKSINNNNNNNNNNQINQNTNNDTIFMNNRNLWKYSTATAAAPPPLLITSSTLAAPVTRSMNVDATAVAQLHQQQHHRQYLHHQRSMLNSHSYNHINTSANIVNMMNGGMPLERASRGTIHSNCGNNSIGIRPSTVLQLLSGSTMAGTVVDAIAPGVDRVVAVVGVVGNFQPINATAESGVRLFNIYHYYYYY